MHLISFIIKLLNNIKKIFFAKLSTDFLIKTLFDLYVNKILIYMNMKTLRIHQELLYDQHEIIVN